MIIKIVISREMPIVYSLHKSKKDNKMYTLIIIQYHTHTNNHLRNLRSAKWQHTWWKITITLTQIIFLDILARILCKKSIFQQQYATRIFSLTQQESKWNYRKLKWSKVYSRRSFYANLIKKYVNGMFSLVLRVVCEGQFMLF